MSRWRESQYLTRRGPAAGVTRRFRLSLVVMVFLSIALLVLSRMEHDTVKHVRWQLTELMTPLLGTVSAPLEQMRRAGRTLTEVFALASDVERLKDENQRLKGWEWRAVEAERKLSELSELSSVVKEKAMAFVTSRVIANSSGPFVRSALINVGTDHAIKTGFPVLSGDGLVGRIVETGDSSAQVLLLTDLNSRIPVHVGRSGIRAVVAGDNGPLPRLTFLPEAAEITPGDEVSTSGIGGLFPRGLRIGTVVKDGVGLRIKPHTELDRLEYLSVIFYENPTLGLIEGAQGARGIVLREDAAKTGWPAEKK